jgi:hypothetical protein
LRGLIAKARNPLVHRFARCGQASDVYRATFTSDVLRGLAVASIKQCVCSRDSGCRRRFVIGHYRYKSFNCLAGVFAGEFSNFGHDFGSPTWIPALALLKWFSNSHAVSLLF